MNRLVTIIKNTSAHKIGGFVRACFAVTGIGLMTLGVLTPQAAKAMSINPDYNHLLLNSIQDLSENPELGGGNDVTVTWDALNQNSYEVGTYNEQLYNDVWSDDLHVIFLDGDPGVYPIFYNNIGGMTPNSPAVSVPWETDALPIIGSTVILGLGIWAKRKLTK